MGKIEKYIRGISEKDLVGQVKDYPVILLQLMCAEHFIQYGKINTIYDQIYPDAFFCWAKSLIFRDIIHFNNSVCTIHNVEDINKNWCNCMHNFYVRVTSDTLSKKDRVNVMFSFLGKNITVDDIIDELNKITKNKLKYELNKLTKNNLKCEVK